MWNHDGALRRSSRHQGSTNRPDKLSNDELDHRSRRLAGLSVRAPVRLLAAIAGLVYLRIGILGVVPGITTRYDSLAFAGEGSHARLVGAFQVSVSASDLLHVVLGAGILLGARSLIRPQH